MGVLAVLIVAGMGLIMRNAYLITTTGNPVLETPVPGLDIDLHWQTADELLAEASEREPRFALISPSAPLFPSYLALAKTVFGDSMLSQRALMSVWGMLTILLLMGTVYRLEDGRLGATAVITGALAAFYPALIYFDTQLLKASLELTLLSCWLFVWAKSPRLEDGRAYFVWCLAQSVLVAALLMSQLNAFLYGVILILLLGCERKRAWPQKLSGMGVVVVVMLLAVGLFSTRDHFSSAPHPIYAPVFGIHIHVGFHEQATGYYYGVKGIPGFPFGHTFITRVVAETRQKRPLTFAESDRYWREQAWNFIKENPERAWELVRTKLWYALQSFEVKGNDFFESLLTQSALLRATPLRIGWLLVLAPFGVVWFIRKRRPRTLLLLLGLIISVLLSVSLTFVTWRYRLHMLLPLFILAGTGAAELVGLGRLAWARSWRPLRWAWLPLLVSMALASVSFAPVPDGVRSYMQGRDRINNSLRERAVFWQGKLAEAEQAPERMVYLWKLHRHSQAFLVAQALVEDPERANATSRMYYVRYLAWLGWHENVRELLLRLRREDPQAYDELLRALPPKIREWVHALRLHRA